MNFQYKLASTTSHLISKYLLGVKVSGLENIPADGAVILASNHVSYVDPPLIGGISSRELYYLAKKELFKNRLFGAYIRSLNAFPVDRDRLDPSTIKTILKVLRDGYGLLMFPEGTRRIDGILGEFNNGVAAVALKTGATVVPTWITNSYPVIRNRFRGRRLRVAFGRPILPDELLEIKADEDSLARFNRELRDRMVQLGNSWK